MSQTSFLESVVSWDEQQCRRNVDEALPQLLFCLKETDSLQEEIGIMKIVCQSFLPCLLIHEADSRLFSAISRTSCQTWDKVVDDIKELPKHGTVQQDLHTLLELMVELLDICLLCVKFVQGADNLEMCAVHSLPYGAVHLLKGSYSHCKECACGSGARLARNAISPISPVTATYTEKQPVVDSMGFYFRPFNS